MIDQDGELIARGTQFDEELIVCDIDPSTVEAARLRDARHRPAARMRRPAVADLGRFAAPAHHDSTEVGGPRAKPLEPDAEVYAALCLGLRDYVEKNEFGGVLLGLSGGIDSALTACIAVDALGSDKVRCAVMPSPHSSAETQGDARTLADNLGIERYEFELAPLMQDYEQTLAEVFAGTESGVAEENIQARIRGNLLMALSNKFGWLVLTTGNKSEYSVGYATLYGDMAGGFGVLKDVPKTLVYRLAHYRNSLGKPVIPAGDHRAAAVRRAEARAAGLRLATALRPAGRDPRGLRRAGPGPRAADPPRDAGRRRRPRDPDGRRRRVQAPPGSPGNQDLPPRVRPRPAPADHESLQGVTPVSSRRVSDRDRRADQGAELACVVGDLDLPDPGGAAAAADRGRPVHVCRR